MLALNQLLIALCQILIGGVVLVACEVEAPPLATQSLDYGLPILAGDSIGAGERGAGERMSGEGGSGEGGSGDDGGEEAIGGDEVGEEWPDMRGNWRIEHFTTLRSELPVLLEEIETQVQATILAEVTQEGAELWLHHQICDVTMTNTPSYNQTILPDLFISSLPLKTRRARLIKERIDSGDRYELLAPLWYDLRSVELDDPSVDPLPSVSSDPRVFDQDRDGLAGLSAKLVGFPDGEVGLIQKSWDEWRGSIELDPERESALYAQSVGGAVSWGQEQQIIETTNEVLLIDVRRWIPEETSPPTLHYFEMERIETLSCPPRRPAPRPSQ